MRKFGLIGYPLGHSFSKKYFNEKFLKEYITDASYELYPLEDINQFTNLVSDNVDLCGLNVTIPYKSAILKFLDSIDTEAREIGAVNVLKIKRLGSITKISGYNSDITGIKDSLSPFIKDNVRNAIVLGTGGSSRAVCYVLRKSGINITRISRERKPGASVYTDIDAEMISNTELIINTTPLGMFPNIEAKPDINYSLLSEKHTLFDLVYNPEITSFLKMGLERGCTIIKGIKMLQSQADRAWEIWNDDSL